jgi:hypothetical protein
MSQQEQSVQNPKPTDANYNASDPVADDLANREAAAVNYVWHMAWNIAHRLTSVLSFPLIVLQVLQRIQHYKGVALLCRTQIDPI